MSPPKIGPAVLCRYPAPLLAKLDVIAASRGVTRAELLRRAALELVEREISSS